MSKIEHLIDTIIIDGKDRLSTSTSTTDFVVYMQRPGQDTLHYEIKKMEIPLTWDNVSSVNNVLTIAGSGITLTAGLYDITGLVNELNTQSTGYNWTYLDNNRLKIDNGGGANFALIPGIASELLGFDSSSTYTGANTYTADYFPNLAQNHEYLTLHSKELSKRGSQYHHSDKRSDIIACIPVKEDYGTSQTWEPKQRLLIPSQDMHIYRMDFTLKNRIGSTVDLDNKTFQIVMNRYG